MIISWDETENRFIAQFSDFQNDLDSVKTAEFRTSGPPGWLWFAPTPGIKALDRLRKSPPKSGLEITTLALEHYKSLTEKQLEKDNLRKQFKRAQKQAKKPVKSCEVSTDGMYFDQDIQIWCFPIMPSKIEFILMYTRPADPEERCLLCDSPLYPPFEDHRTFCMHCEKSHENNT
jgi:hypothetical protein